MGDHDRTWVLEQVYQEALAVQVALGEELTAHRVTVAPIVCAIGGLPRVGGAITGVQLTGVPQLEHERVPMTRSTRAGGTGQPVTVAGAACGVATRT